MSADFLDVQAWAAGLLARLEPAQRRKVNRRIAQELRRSESHRIGAQVDPDGQRYTPRKARKNLRGQKGAIRRKLFARMRTAQHLKASATNDAAAVGFSPRTSRIGWVHQRGLRDRPAPGAPDVRYPVRRLLGFSDAMREQVLDTLAEFLVGNGM